MKNRLRNLGYQARFVLIHGRPCPHENGDWWPCDLGRKRVRLCRDCGCLHVQPVPVEWPAS